jgi:hypothetical protein
MGFGKRGGKFSVPKGDLPHAGGVALLIALAILSNCSGVLNQPHRTFTACGRVIAGLGMVLDRNRAKNEVTWARRVTKAADRKHPKP